MSVSCLCICGMGGGFLLRKDDLAGGVDGRNGLSTVAVLDDLQCSEVATLRSKRKKGNKR